jgi:hypothetical protein
LIGFPVKGEARQLCVNAVTRSRRRGFAATLADRNPCSVPLAADQCARPKAVRPEQERGAGTRAAGERASGSVRGKTWAVLGSNQ